ncbi:UNVERIFIED_CONTAM: hypothetical protein PYX00_000292 [Menopon gallinae]|uniref:Insulin-like receptor n=1 Tax=Menopon gallinae TaxID=328185 RepID=A0AAW2I8P9_9NEOP
MKSPTGECCHKSCLGGCFGKTSKDCFACSGVVLNNECLEKCPPNMYKYVERRCVTAMDCLNISKPYDWEIRELNRPYPFRPVLDTCSIQCPANFHEEQIEVPKMRGRRYKCVPCKGRCKKECYGAKIENIAAIQKLEGCTHIVGSLEIQLRSGGNIVDELENSLSSIEEISGYLKVVRSLPLVSLDFLRNLRLIKGEELESNKSAFVLLDNENLEELWDWSTRDKDIRIENGRLAFYLNPKLCFEKIQKFNEIAKMPEFTPEEVPPESNGDKVACNISPLSPYVVTKNLNATAVLIKWNHFQHYDQRKLLGYAVYYTQAPHRNVTFYHNRNACGGDGWKVDDIALREDGNNDEMSFFLTQLKPFTQYAYYIKTYAISTENSGAQSAINYFVTNPGTPTKPEKLQGYSNSTSEIVITWSPPIEANGNLTHYEISGFAKKELINEEKDFCFETAEKELPPPIPKILPKPDTNNCACEAPPVERGGIRDTEDIRLSKIEFEDALQNAIFVKRTNTARRKREMTYTDSNHQQQLVHQSTSFAGKSIMEKEEAADSLAFSQVAPLTTTQIVIKNLNYFTNYRIEVRACRALVDTEDGKDPPCSENNTIDIRTKKNDKADYIPELTLTQDTVNGTLQETRLRWEEPTNPNGLILSYQIEYRRVESEKFKSTIECITRQAFLEQKKEYVLKNLAPGNYTVRVLASSLAGDGPYSPSKHFYIPLPTHSTLLDIWSGVLGAFIVSGIFCGIFILWKKKTTGVPKLFANVNPEYVSAATVYVPDEWEVPRKNIELIRELGQGSFGMVYEGIARDIVPGHPEVRCAVKTVNDVATDRDRMEFLNEASVMKAFNTHHVVQLLGVVSEGQPTLVVMELMVNGDLKTYLRSHRPEFCEDKKRQPPTLKRILGMAIEIADGMAYLAAKKFVHRDLAARNCMVAEDLTVKIGDFGMTRDIYETDYYKKGTKGLLPVRWMAPESLKDGVFTTHSDVWSYGVVLWEMVTLASQPYQGLSNDQVLRYVIEGGVMERPENCPDKLYELMKLCWQYKPTARPHFMDFVTALLSDASPEFCKNSYYHGAEGRELRAHLDNADTELIAPTSGTPLRLATDIEDFSVGGSEPEMDEDEEEAELDVEPPFVSPQRGILSSGLRAENWLKGQSKPAALASVSSSDSSRASKLSNGGANTPVNGYIVGRSSNGTRTTQC